MRNDRFNPFPGLRPFRMDEIYLFFGREEQTAELLQRLRRTRFLAVVGTSGSGKSSLVQAGLLPELHGGMMLQAGSHWEMAVMRPGGNPMTNLAEALVKADLFDADRENAVLEARATLSRSGLGLVEAIRQSDLEKGSNLLLVVDQFEEIFRFRRSGSTRMEEAGAFVNLLLEASRNTEIPIYIALTMRSDYLGDCSEFPGLAEAVNDGEYLIPRMGREQKRSAISGPVKVGGGEMAPRLLQKLLNDVGDDPDHLPILQHALMRTWEEWERDHQDGEAIDLRHYQAVGGMAEALSRHADEVYFELPDDHARGIAEKMFKALTERSSDNRGIRRPAQLRKLCAIADADPDTMVAVVDPFRQLGRTFLMPPEDQEILPSTVIDISHESLMRVWTRLDGWVEDEAQSARIYHRLVDTVALYRDGKAGLYHDPDLQIAQSWRAEEIPNEAWADQYGGHFDEAMQFLERSGETARRAVEEKEAARQHELQQARELAEAQQLRVEEQERAGRRLKTLLAAAAAIAVVAIGASVFAARQMRKAESSETAANTLAAELKTTLVQGDWDLSYGKLESGDGAASLAYLARAMRNDPSYTRAGMRSVATLSSGSIPTQRFAPIEHDTPINSVLHNEKHDLLVASSGAGRDVRIWDFETGLQRGTLQTLDDLPIATGDPGPASAEITARIKNDFAGARRIWLAADPEEPPKDPRFFHKSIGLPAGRALVRADFFVEADDSFTLSVNGAELGGGEDYDTTFHAGLEAAALAGGLELSIVAHNHLGPAGLVVAAFLTFADGEPVVVASDPSWQSSIDPDTGFADSRDYPAKAHSGKNIEEISTPVLNQLQFSSDQDRGLGYTPGRGRITSWDLVTGKPTGTSIGVPALKRFKVAKSDTPGDLVGCEFTDDGSIQVWNLTTGEAVTPRLKTQGNVVTWDFTRDGGRIVGLFADGRIGVWETGGGAEIARLDTRPTRADMIYLSPGGDYVVATDVGKHAVIWWEITTGISTAASWVDVPFGFDQLQFLPSGGAFSVVGSEGDSILRAQTYSLASRERLADISSNPKAIRMNLTGEFGIAGAVNANVVTVWDLMSGSILQQLMAPEILESANLSPDGRRVIAGSATTGTAAAAGSAEKKLFVFDLFLGRVAIPKPIVLAGPSPISFSPDAETLVTIDPSEQAVRFWDLRSGRQLREPVAASSIGSATFSRSGTRVALFQFSTVAYGTESIGQRTGRLFLEQVGVPPALPEFLSERGADYGMMHAPSDGERWMLWSRRPGDTGAQIIVRDARSLEVVRSIDVEVAGGSAGYRISWSNDGARVIFPRDPKTAAVIDVASGDILKKITHEANVFAVALSSDGSVAACGFEDGVVKIWSARDGERSIDPFPEVDAIKSLVFSPDGSLLGIGDRTKCTFAVIDTSSGELRIAPRPTVLPADDFAFTPDGRSVIVAAAGSDGKVPMFDLASGELVREFVIGDWSRNLDVSPDGRVLAVGSGGTLTATSGVAYLFEVTTGRQLTPPLAAGGTVMDVAFGPRGEVVATGTYQTATGFGYAQLWDAATGRALTDPLAGHGSVTKLAFLPDGSALAIGWSDGIVNLIPVPPRDAIPGWLPGLAEAVADRRLAPDTGVIEEVGGDRLERLRSQILAADPKSDAGDPWFPWAHWLFENPQERAIFPGAKTTMAHHLARLRAGDDIFDLHQAVRWSPGDALSHARLAILYQANAPGNLPAPAKAHWDDASVWFSDRALALAPDNVDVWTMRGELMRRLNRSDAAAEATERVLALAPADREADNPNALYQNAIALATSDKWDEAEVAFSAALDLLDAYRSQLDAGEQPLPLLGVLPSLVPTREFSAKQKPAAADVGAGSWSAEPIPGAFEDFEGVVDGGLPDGWRVSNHSDHDNRPGVHHLAVFQSDLWMDWVVLGRQRIEHLGGLPDRVLEEASKPAADGGGPPLLDGGFALAVSQNRSGNQVQFLESPDFDCTGQAGVHLSFHSAFEAHQGEMGIVEYSIDRGESWLPARYFVHQAFLDEARSNEPGKAVDLDKLLDTPRPALPWWIEAGAGVTGGTYGAFVSAPRDLPGLLECFEGRRPAAGNNRTEFKKIEGFPLPGADGQATVRLRFGLAAVDARYWGIDNVGLHAGAETQPQGGRGQGEAKLVRPAKDALKLSSIAFSQGFGVGAASADFSKITEQLAAAGTPGVAPTTPSADSAPDAGATGTKPKPAGIRENLIQARLIMEHALTQEGSSDPEVRASAAALLIFSMEIDRAWKLLTASDDFDKDLANPRWREMTALVAFLRGGIAAQFNNRDGAYTLLSAADQLLEGNGGPRPLIRQAMAELGNPDAQTDPTADVVLLKRGATWNYFDEGRLPAADWNQPDFDDSRWFRNRATLGYGGDGEVTVVQFGPDDKNKFTTTYFRTPFELADPRAVGSLALRVRRDDGVVIYLNGTEIARDIMPDGAIDYETFASPTIGDAAEARYETIAVNSTSMLRQGTNWLAAEVHQVNAGSSDLAFDLELVSAASSAEVAAASPLPIPVIATQMESLGFPAELRSYLLWKMVEAHAGRGDAESLSEGVELALASRGAAAHEAKTGAAQLLRLRALVAASKGDDRSADSLYTEALETVFAQVDALEPFEPHKLPVTLREAALIVRRGPADLAYLYSHTTRWQKVADSESALLLRWARKAVGDDPAALAELSRGLDSAKRYEDALTILDSLLARGTPPPGAAPAAIRAHKKWLRMKASALAGLGRKAEAAALESEIYAAPPRDPASPANLIDLTAYYNASLYDGGGWEKANLNLGELPETYQPTARAPAFDLRGLIQLRGGKNLGGDRYPSRIDGIKVGTRSPAAHFLIGAADALEVQGKEAELGRLIIHYTDGGEETLSLTSEVNILDYWRHPTDSIDPDLIAWSGRNTGGEKPRFQLEHVAWKNPHPDKTIRSIDFVSSVGGGAPFLVAITMDPAGKPTD